MIQRFYGVFDPITQSIEHIAPCAKCGNQRATCIYDLPRKSQVPGLVDQTIQQLYRRAYFVSCPECSAVGLAAKKQWQAVIAWNKSPSSIKHSLSQFPVFGINELDRSEAKQRLKHIRSDLELRKKERLTQGDRLYNNHYEKLRAFLAWSIYAQTVVKLTK